MISDDRLVSLSVCSKLVDQHRNDPWAKCDKSPDQCVSLKGKTGSESTFNRLIIRGGTVMQSVL